MVRALRGKHHGLPWSGFRRRVPASFRSTSPPADSQSPRRCPRECRIQGPATKRHPSTTEIVSTILPFLLRRLETNSTTTGVSFSSRSARITPHPCALTTVVSYLPEKLCAGSRLVITIGICRDRRVLRLTSFLRSSAVPSLGLNARTDLRVSSYGLLMRWHVSSTQIYENRTK
jgi:hypothetical protein